MNAALRMSVASFPRRSVQPFHRRGVDHRVEVVFVGIEEIDRTRIDIEDARRVVDDVLGDFRVGFGIEEITRRLL
jgi:hypothetical protein